jgi:hypothetical protein
MLKKQNLNFLNFLMVQKKLIESYIVTKKRTQIIECVFKNIFKL